MATNARSITDLTVQVGAEIRKQRNDRGWTLKELADASGSVAFSTLSRMENGASAIDLAQIEAIALAFDMRPEDLIHMARSRAAVEVATYQPPKPSAEIYAADGHLDRGYTQTASMPGVLRDEIAEDARRRGKGH